MTDNLYEELNDRSKLIFKSVVDTYLKTGAPSGSETILKKADVVISLSKMTLTHSFAAIILSEQIYRSLTIKIGHPYHRQ